MRLALGTAVAIALSATGLLGNGQATPPTPQASTGTAAISGVVTDAVTGRPLAGASVSILVSAPNGRTLPFSKPPELTDARGRFVLADLPAGAPYEVFATRAGYAFGRYEGAVSSAKTPTGQTVPIKLADGEWLRDANIRMWRLGSMAGRVVDERGEPVVGCAVRAFSRRLIAGHQLLVPGAVATTDDRGAYRLAALPPGQYLVGVLSVQATVPVSIADGSRRLPLGGLEGRGAAPPPVSRPEAAGASIDVDGRHRLVLSTFATPPPSEAECARPREFPLAATSWKRFTPY